MPDMEDIIEQEYDNITHSRKCGELLGKGILNCTECVTLACTILEDYQFPVKDYEEKPWYAEVKDISKLF